MIRKFDYIIDNTYSGLSINNYLKEIGYSSHIIIQLKKDVHCIHLNSKPVYANTILSTNDKLSITLFEYSNPKIVLANIPISIIYEDADILIVNKTSNLSIHPSQGNFDNTLANAVAYYLAGKNEDCPFRCINRLDRDTTGLVIIAKNRLSCAILSDAMRSRDIKRTYIALVEGKCQANGMIDAPIGRLHGSTIERTVDYQHGEYAVTKYELIECYNNRYSLIRLNLETGRTHQIRVHLKHIGHPLIGDFIYNPNYELINRQALHSYSLEFVHPITKKKLQFNCNLPDDFKNAIQKTNS